MPTDNHAYNDPDYGSSRWDIPVIDNITEYDRDIELRDVAANRANYIPKTNAKYLSIDTGEVHIGNGTAWNFLGVIQPDTALNDAERDLQPEGGQTGLAADTAGVKYEGATRQLLDPRLLEDARSVYLEAATAVSAGDVTVTVELYDDTAVAVAASHAITGGSTRSRSADINASLTPGNEVHVRYNVTTASATAGATFDALTARLIIE